MYRVAPLAALAIVLLSSGVAQAQYYTTYYPTTTYYRPATVYYASVPAPTTVAYAEAPADSCSCATVQPATYTTTYYTPTTTYYAPTTTYYAATPAVVYYRAAPRYASFYRWW